MKTVLIGEVRTAEHALRGLLRAGYPPCAIYTTDISEVKSSSGMESGYYCDLLKWGRDEGIPTRIVSSDLRPVVEDIRGHEPDYLWVMGWPYIVRDYILDVAPCIGMHPTPLPRRRGGAPMNWTLLDAEQESAVSLFRMRSGIDNGEILMQEAFAIDIDDYVEDVAERIYTITEDLVAESTKMLVEGTATWKVQDEAQATYTRRRKPVDGRIGWNDSATRIRNLVRATSHPFPGAFTELNGDKVRVWRAEHPVAYKAPLKALPGTVLEVRQDGVLVSTADNALLVTEAQLEGGLPLVRQDLAAAFSPNVGERLV